MARRQNDLVVYGNTFAWLVCVFCVVGGCGEPRRTGDTECCATSYDSRQEIHGNREELNSASALGQSLSYMQLPGGKSLPRFLDRTTDGCPPALLSTARKVLGEDILQAWGGQTPWPPTKKVYAVVGESGEVGIFLERDGAYVHVNSGAELLAISEIVGEFKFTRQDFDDPHKVHFLLGEIASLHQGPGRCAGSGVMLRKTMGRDFEWLRGTEEDGAVLRELSRDPHFTFDGNTWSVMFNVFKADGSVDRWRVVGEHDPQANRNQILNIEIAPLKPAGTFSWPFMP